MKVVVAGSGIVGSAIAFHLASLGLEVEVWEADGEPGGGATGAALGVLMAVSSSKVGGRAATLRLESLKIYDQWLPFLSGLTGRRVLLHQGIFCVPTDRLLWENLALARQAQGYCLQPMTLGNLEGFFSPADRVVHPLALLGALIEGAARKGARFHWGRRLNPGEQPQADRVIISAGMGSVSLAGLSLQPVGGQGIEVRAYPGDLPAVHIVDGEGDFNIVPLGNDRYWIGATVEFDPTALPRAENVDYLVGRAGAYFPSFLGCEVLSSWASYRPRPVGRSAPVIEWLSDRWLVASGHYRNGILLAPITAKIVSEMITE